MEKCWLRSLLPNNYRQYRGEAMNIQHTNIKFYLEDPEAVNLAEYAAVFNTWIQQQRLEELLIDVADYLHVHNGPGIMLIGHEADYSLVRKNHTLHTHTPS